MFSVTFTISTSVNDYLKEEELHILKKLWPSAEKQLGHTWFFLLKYCWKSCMQRLCGLILFSFISVFIFSAFSFLCSVTTQPPSRLHCYLTGARSTAWLQLTWNLCSRSYSSALPWFSLIPSLLTPDTPFPETTPRFVWIMFGFFNNENPLN